MPNPAEHGDQEEVKNDRRERTEGHPGYQGMEGQGPESGEARLIIVLEQAEEFGDGNFRGACGKDPLTQANERDEEDELEGVYEIVDQLDGRAI